MAGIEIGTAYVSIVPSTRRLGPEIQQALRRVGPLNVDVRPRVDTRGLGRGATGGLRSEGMAMGNVMGSAISAGIMVGIVGATAAVAGLVETYKAVITTGLSFERQMNNLSAVTGSSAADLQKMRMAAQNLGSDTKLAGTSASDAAAAMTELAKAGMSVEQSITAARSVLQLATAGQIDAAKAAEMVSTAMNVWGIDASKATDIADDFAAAVLASSLDMPDLAQAMQAGANAGQTFGISMEDTLATLATFAQLGIKGSDAGTLFKTMLLSWQNPSEPQAQAMEELNLQLSDAEGHFVGILPLMEQLKTAHDRMTEAEYNNAAAAVFGSDAFRGAAIAGGRGIPIYNAVKKEIEGTGQAANMASAQLRGLPGVIEAISNTWEGLKLSGFDIISDPLIEGLQNVGNWVATHKPEIIAAFGEITKSVVDFTSDGIRALGNFTVSMGDWAAAIGDTAGGIAKAMSWIKRIQGDDASADALEAQAEGLFNWGESLRDSGRAMIDFADNAGTRIQNTLDGYIDRAKGAAEFTRDLGGATAEIKGADITITGNFEEIKSKIDTTKYDIEQMPDGSFKIIPKTEEATHEMAAWRAQQEGTPIGVDVKPRLNVAAAQQIIADMKANLGMTTFAGFAPEPIGAPSESPFSNWMGYDTGGWLQQGATMVMNKTGKPELVLNPKQQKNLLGALGAAGVDPGSIAPHMSGLGGAINGQRPTDTFRTEGFMPAVAQGNTGVAGTSSLAAIFNLGNEAVGGLIDTGASIAKMAISAAATAGVGAGTMGAGAAAGPAASAAAGYGVDLLASIGKRASSYGFQMASIFADSGIEQLFPLGAPRWLGYDYTSFVPQLGIQQALTTSLEQAAGSQIDQMFGGGQRAAAIRSGAAATGALNNQMAAGFAAARGTGNGRPMPKPDEKPAKNPYQMALGGMFGVFDTGGELPHGMAALNLSGRPEYVLSPQQWASVQDVAPGRGGGATYYVQGVNLDDTMRELQKKERRNNMRYTARSGLGT